MTSSKQNWMQELIRFCRSLSKKKLKQLEGVDQLSFEILNAFRFYCQIFAVDIKEVGRCLLLIIHDKKEVDEKVLIYEAESLHEASSILNKQILKKEYFQRTKKIGVEVASAIGDVLSEIGARSPEILVPATRLFVEEKNRDSLLLLSKTCFSMDSKTFVEKWFEEKSRILSQRSLQNLEREGVKVGTAIGGLWHPPIIIEEAPVLLSSVKVAECNYKGYKILLYNNGIIAVVVSDKIWDYFARNQETAIEILNEITGTSNLFGVRGISFKINDLIFFAVRYDKMDIVAQFYGLEFTTRSLITESSTSAVTKHRHKSLMIVGKEAILEIIAKAEKLTSDLKTKTYISTYLDAVTHFHALEYKTSFLLSWILLEKYIEDVWCDALKKNKVAKRRYDKLTGIFWSADDKIECLNLLGYFSKKRYSELMSLKTLRNQILHEDKKVDQEKTKRSLDLCKTIILEMTK
jgi:hypothetical protein